MNPSDKPPLLTILPPLKDLDGFASLLQHGLQCAVERPIHAQHFLLSLPGFTGDYIAQAVQTVFINGVAADSLDRDLPAGSILALSAAMPGLAGAIFRRQGVHGSLRSRPVAAGPTPTKASGFITLKLFNSIASDRVFDLLTQGVTMRGQAVHDFAIRRTHLFQPPVILTLDGQKVGYDELIAVLPATPLVQIRAIVPSEPA